MTHRPKDMVDIEYGSVLPTRTDCERKRYAGIALPQIPEETCGRVPIYSSTSRSTTIEQLVARAAKAPSAASTGAKTTPTAAKVSGISITV